MKRSAHVTLLLTSAVVLSACQPPASSEKEATPPPASESAPGASPSPTPSATPTPVASSGGSGFLMGLLAGRMFSRGGEQATAGKANVQPEKQQTATARSGFGGYGSSSAGS